MSAPRLTVALPTYNGARHLAETLARIDELEADGITFDLLVCDDRSDDGTTAVVSRVAGDRARILVHSERLGLAGNWNQCVAQSRTPLVSIVHQDDLLLPGHLIRALETYKTLSEHGPPGMVVAAATAIDANGQPLPSDVIDPGTMAVSELTKRFPPDALACVLSAFAAYFAPGGFVRVLVAENPVRCSGVLLSREAHQALGGFDPSFRYAVDWDFWLRLSRRYAVAWILSPPGVAFRWHLASETHRFKTSLIDLQEQERLLADMIAGNETDRPLRRRARSRLARAYLNRAYDAARAGNRALEGKALRRAFRLNPATVARLLVDPRLLGRLILGRRDGSAVSNSS